MFNYEVVLDREFNASVFIEGDRIDQDTNWLTIYKGQTMVFTAPYNRILYVLCEEKEKDSISLHPDTMPGSRHGFRL